MLKNLLSKFRKNRTEDVPKTNLHVMPIDKMHELCINVTEKFSIESLYIRTIGTKIKQLLNITVSESEPGEPGSLTFESAIVKSGLFLVICKDGLGNKVVNIFGKIGFKFGELTSFKASNDGLAVMNDDKRTVVVHLVGARSKSLNNRYIILTLNDDGNVEFIPYKNRVIFEAAQASSEDDGKFLIAINESGELKTEIIDINNPDFEAPEIISIGNAINGYRVCEFEKDRLSILNPKLEKVGPAKWDALTNVDENGIAVGRYPKTKKYYHFQVDENETSKSMNTDGGYLTPYRFAEGVGVVVAAGKTKPEFKLIDVECNEYEKIADFPTISESKYTFEQIANACLAILYQSPEFNEIMSNPKTALDPQKFFDTIIAEPKEEEIDESKI